MVSLKIKKYSNPIKIHNWFLEKAILQTFRFSLLFLFFGIRFFSN